MTTVINHKHMAEDTHHTGHCGSLCIQFGHCVRAGRTAIFMEAAHPLILVILAGHWVGMRSVIQVTGALDNWVGLMSYSARLLTDSGTEAIKTKVVKEGDRFVDWQGF